MLPCLSFCHSRREPALPPRRMPRSLFLHPPRRKPRRPLPQHREQPIRLASLRRPILKHPMPLPKRLRRLPQQRQPRRNHHSLAPEVPKLRTQQRPSIPVQRSPPQIRLRIRMLLMQRRPARVHNGARLCDQADTHNPAGAETRYPPHNTRQNPPLPSPRPHRSPHSPDTPHAAPTPGS